MKQTFTRLLSAGFVTALAFSSLAVKAQSVAAGSNTPLFASNSSNADAKAGLKAKPENDGLTAAAKSAVQAPADTSWKPVRRLWGYSFGDFYYAGHAEPATSSRGGETNYNGVPTYRNAFQFRRIYLGYDYDITKKFSVEALLASEPSASTGLVSATTTITGGTSTASTATTVSNSDNLVDNKMAFYIKYLNLRWRGIFTGTDFVIGEMPTPGFALMLDRIWGYRSIEKSVADFHKTNSYDLGAALQGTFDPATKNFGYDLMVGNNTQASLLSAANANSGFFKAFYGDLYAKFFGQKLIIDVYADYMQTASSTPGSATTPFIGQQSHNMVKGFIAYNTPKLTVGVEAYTQHFKNGVTATDGLTKVPMNADAQAISAYVHGVVYKDKIAFFARNDGYNPDNDINTVNTYAKLTNFSSYDPYTKEHFFTGGLDFTPAKNVHFMPNIWYIQYKDQRAPGTTGYVPDNHTVVYRMTFFFQFGK